MWGQPRHGEAAQSVRTQKNWTARRPSVHLHLTMVLDIPSQAVAVSTSANRLAGGGTANRSVGADRGSFMCVPISALS